MSLGKRWLDIILNQPFAPPSFQPNGHDQLIDMEPLNNARAPDAYR